MLEPFHSDALRHLRVSISGQWLSSRTRDWRGEVRSDEPIVAVSFCVRGREISWSKSEPANSIHPIRLLLGHFDAEGHDVQVNFSIGGDGHVRTRTSVVSSSYQPAIQPSLVASTSTLLPFASIEGSHDVQLSVLFLAGSDVKTGRNRLWHLRAELVDSVPEVFRSLLARGRSGELAAA